MRPLWFSTAVFISGVRIIARRSCFLASTVFHESIFFQDFILFVVMSNYGYKINTLSRWKKKSRSVCWSRSWFENIDGSDNPFLWGTKENTKATGKCHLFTFFSMITSMYALFVWWVGNMIQEVHKAEWPKQERYQGRIYDWTVQSRVSIAKCCLL